MDKAGGLNMINRRNFIKSSAALGLGFSVVAECKEKPISFLGGRDESSIDWPVIIIMLNYIACLMI